MLLGEATHGSAEFYRTRERISRELIERKGFSFIAIEGDWPDAARIDHYVRHATYPASEWTAFALFPTWTWRNREVREFVDWLRKRNGLVEPGKRIAFHGLDLYSLYTSIRSILTYLDDIDAQTAQVARQRYGCLTPWQADPATYGHAALTGTYQTCEHEVVSMLSELLQKHRAYAEHDGERFLDAVQNAKLVASAEQYYRIMCYGSRASWYLRDSHMFGTLQNLLHFHGPESKAIIWAHNSHVGDSAATEMSVRGEYNIGHLCRQEFGSAAYCIGFGTDSGTVAAASDWDGPMEIKTIRPGQTVMSGCATMPAARDSCCRCEKSNSGRPHRRPVEAPARACHRRDLPARDGAAKSLFSGRAPAPVRRIYLVRQDRSGYAVQDGRTRGASGYLSIRHVTCASRS